MPKDKSETKKKVLVVEEVEEPQIEESVNVAQVEDETETSSVVESEKKEENLNQPVESEPQNADDHPNYLWIIVPTALLVGALVGGLITYFSGISSLSQTSSPSPEPTQVASLPTSAPESTSTPNPSVVSKDTLKIQILNGSGVSGAAGKAKAYLEGLGYKNIETGNASSSNFQTTEVSIKSSKKDIEETILKDLAKEYEVGESTKVLAASSKYDIIVTLGVK